MRRWLPWLIVVVLATVLLIFSVPVEVVKWIGRKKLQVEVRVIDTDSVQPVVGAEVTIFDGPKTYFEGGIPGREGSGFTPDPASAETETRMTNSDGYVSFSFAFTAYGGEGPWSHSGAVVTSGGWLRITAPNRPPALVPLDRQSVGLRDIHDETPLVVTVVLNKCKAD